MSFYVQAAGLIAASLLLSLGGTRAVISYACRYGMLDHPGYRRSHRISTPRGGGAGLVLTLLFTLPLCLSLLSQSWPARVTAGVFVALGTVAFVGWLDDKHSLSARLRFAVQLLATGLFSGLLLHGGGFWWWPCLLLAGTWSINLHNFMDGIDGLLAQQGVFVSIGLSLITYLVGQLALSTVCACTAAACLGFLRYNMAPARIFMGDVGSGSLGLLLFIWIAMLWHVHPHAIWPSLILCSAFVTDASLTLLHRISRGRLWYSAHREHLYQWMVRTNYSHAAVVMCYLAWNTLVVLPLAVISLFFASLALPCCLLTYLVATVIWLVMKRRLLRCGQP